MSQSSYARVHQSRQDRMESDFMSMSTIPALTSDGIGLKTQEHSPQSVGSKPKLDVSSAASLSFTWLGDAARQLQEIRLEVEEACELDSETEVVPESAYDEAYFLLNVLHPVIPMPDIMWLEDGGIGFEWITKSGKGIGTISLYGDNRVIYGISLGSMPRVKGTRALSDLAALGDCFEALSGLCS